MSNKLTFHSQFAEILTAFISEKRGLGNRYYVEERTLYHFDQYVCSIGYHKSGISKSLFEQWTVRQAHEREKTCENRRNVLSQFCRYMVRLGGDAYVPPRTARLRRDLSYRPHIFSDEEITKFLKSAKTISGDEWRKEIIYMLFSLLISTGMRLGEATQLERKDVNFTSAPVLITIRHAKFDKDRIIPISQETSQQLHVYMQKVQIYSPNNMLLFPTRNGTPFKENNVYMSFRKILWAAGISHGGPGKGPRIHDFRHPYVKSKTKNFYPLQ